jgi:hypothetical protein
MFSFIRPTVIVFGFCLGASVGACVVNTDDDDGSCHEDCDEGFINCRGECDDDDNVCIGDCELGFSDCSDEC